MRATYDPGPLEPTSPEQLAAYRDDVIPGLEQVRDDVWALGLGQPAGVRPLTTLCYLFRDTTGGFLLVDPGWNLEENWDRLVDALAELGAAPEDVHTIVATHSHPDHAGMSSRFVALGARYLLGRDEPSGADSMKARSAIAELRSWGVPLSELARIGRRRRRRRRRERRASDSGRRRPRANFREAMTQAEPTRVVGDGDRLDLPGFELEVIATPGHTPGHICLTDASRDIVLTGDLVLPTRFPGLGLGFSDHDRPAIADYLESLAKLPASREALPGHGFRFHGLETRIRQSAEHQLGRSREVSRILAEDPHASVWRIASRLHWAMGWENLVPSMRFSALRQTAMHLNYVLSGVEIPMAADPD